MDDAKSSNFQFREKVGGTKPLPWGNSAVSNQAESWKPAETKDVNALLKHVVDECSKYIERQGKLERQFQKWLSKHDLGEIEGVCKRYRSLGQERESRRREKLEGLGITMGGTMSLCQGTY